MTEPGAPDQVPMYPVTWPVTYTYDDWCANNNWVVMGTSTSTTAITYNYPTTTNNITYTGGTVGASQNFVYVPPQYDAEARLREAIRRAQEPYPGAPSRVNEGMTRAARLAAGQITDAQAMEEFRLAEAARAERIRLQEQQHAADAQRYRAERRAARDRAQELLENHLTESQRQTYHEASYFDVTVRSGRTWRIYTHNGYAGNVKLLDDQNREVASYCCHSETDMPDADHFFVQMITLQCDEDLFIARGNMSGLVAGFQQLTPDRNEAQARVTRREIAQSDQHRSVSVARERWDQAQARVRGRRAPLPEEPEERIEVEFDWEQDAV